MAVGFHRHKFEREHKQQGDCGADSGGLRSVVKKPDVPLQDRLLLRFIQDAKPDENDPRASRLLDIVARFAGAFKPAHFKVVLSQLAHGSYVSASVHEARRAIAEKLLGAFVDCSEARKTWENTSILQSLGTLRIKDRRTIDSVVDQAAREIRQFGAREVQQCLSGISDLGLFDSKHRRVVGKLSDHVARELDDLDMMAGLGIVNSLADYLSVDGRIFSGVCDKVTSGEWFPSPVELGHLAYSISTVNFRHAGCLGLLTELITSQIKHPQNSDRKGEATLALARCIRATDVLDAPVARNLIAAFAERVQADHESFPEHTRLKIARQLGPVLIVRDIDMPQCMTHLFNSTVNLFSELPSAHSTFEMRVGQVLSDLGIAFERAVHRASFELDFLVQTKAGIEVNLEVDGEMFHLVNRIDVDDSEPEYSARDQYRDKVLQKLGIPVVRIRSTEWDLYGYNEKDILLERKIPSLFKAP